MQFTTLDALLLNRKARLADGREGLVVEHRAERCHYRDIGLKVLVRFDDGTTEWAWAEDAAFAVAVARN